MVEKVACANGKDIKKTSKMKSKSIPKSMINRNKIQTRKRYTQTMKKHQTGDPKRTWKIKTRMKQVQQNIKDI